MKNLILILQTTLTLVAIIIVPISQNTVTAQDIETESQMYKKARGDYVFGIQFLGYGDIKEDGTLPMSSHSAHAFYRAENAFAALAEIHPNYANGKALELQILSSLAYDGDIDFVASRPDKDKILPFLLKVANNEYDVNFNYLDERNSEVRKMKQRDVRYGMFFTQKRAALLQAVHMIDPESLDKIKNLQPVHIYNIYREYVEENNEDKGINLMKEYCNKWPNDYIIPNMLFQIYSRKKDFSNEKKYMELTVKRAPPDKKEFYQKVLDKINEEY